MKKNFLAALLVLSSLLLTAPVGWGAIAFDAGTNSGEQTVQGPFTWNHTITGANPALVVTCGGRAFITDSSVSYNGVALTKVTATANSNVDSETWITSTPPATGTHAVSVTWSGAGDWACGAISFTGVDQSTPKDASGPTNCTGSASPATCTTTTVNAGAWCVASLMVQVIGTYTITSGTQWYDVANSVNNGEELGGYLGPIASPGACTISWTESVAQIWAMTMVSLKPAGATVSAIGVGKRRKLERLNND